MRVNAVSVALARVAGKALPGREPWEVFRIRNGPGPMIQINSRSDVAGQLPALRQNILEIERVWKETQ